MTFGEYMKAQRQMRELTLEQLAAKAGTHKGYISGIEHGKVKPPSPKMIKRLAKAMEMDDIHLIIMAYAEKAPQEIREFVKSKLL